MCPRSRECPDYVTSEVRSSFLLELPLDIQSSSADGLLYVATSTALAFHRRTYYMRYSGTRLSRSSLVILREAEDATMDYLVELQQRHIYVLSVSDG